MGERAVGVEEKRAATLAMERAWLIAALLGAAGRGRLGMVRMGVMWGALGVVCAKVGL